MSVYNVDELVTDVYDDAIVGTVFSMELPMIWVVSVYVVEIGLRVVPCDIPVYTDEKVAAVDAAVVAIDEVAVLPVVLVPVSRNVDEPLVTNTDGELVIANV